MWKKNKFASKSMAYNNLIGCFAALNFSAKAGKFSPKGDGLI